MIFITGGAGYIGSHTCVELITAGYDVTVFDNFCNSQPEALARVQRITGKQPKLIQGDIRDSSALTAALANVNLGEEIPAELYQVVAEVLAYIYRVTDKYPK